MWGKRISTVYHWILHPDIIRLCIKKIENLICHFLYTLFLLKNIIHLWMVVLVGLDTVWAGMATTVSAGTWEVHIHILQTAHPSLTNIYSDFQSGIIDIIQYRVSNNWVTTLFFFVNLLASTNPYCKSWGSFEDNKLTTSLKSLRLRKLLD